FPPSFRLSECADYMKPAELPAVLRSGGSGGRFWGRYASMRTRASRLGAPARATGRSWLSPKGTRTLRSDDAEGRRTAPVWRAPAPVSDRSRLDPGGIGRAERHGR